MAENRKEREAGDMEELLTHYAQRTVDPHNPLGRACDHEPQAFGDVTEELLNKDYPGYMTLIDCSECRLYAEADFT